MSRMARAGLAAALVGTAISAAAPAAGAARPEDELRAAWVGRWVVLRTAAFSNCDERYTNNRLRRPQPSSKGVHRFEPGELGRVDNLHLRRARIDLLVSLAESLRVELRDGPFQLYEQLECRVELEVPAPRAAVRQGAVEQLGALIRGVLERHDSRAAAAESALGNRRRVEPFPEDHEERLAAYHAWKEEQLYLALRNRLTEALDRAGALVSRADRSTAYAQGMVLGARDFGQDQLFSTACAELPAARFSPRWRQAPDDLDDSDARDWKDGFEDGQLLLFEISLAQRLERCLP